MPSGGSHSYYITNSGAGKMLKLQNPKICWGADSITGDMIEGGHNLYVILPYIVSLQDIPSEIGIDYQVERKNNKLYFNKFYRMLMIQFDLFKSFMIKYKTKKKNNL